MVFGGVDQFGLQVSFGLGRAGQINEGRSFPSARSPAATRSASSSSLAPTVGGWVPLNAAWAALHHRRASGRAGGGATPMGFDPSIEKASR